MRGPFCAGSAFYFAMTNQNPDNPIEEIADDVPAPETQAAEASVEAHVAAPVVQEAQPLDARRRLRELLSVPERDRSDEQWDEIIELEIQLAPGNRISGSPMPTSNPPRRSGGGGAQQGRPGGGAGGGAAAGQEQKKHRPRTKNNRRPRQNKPPTGGSPA